MAVVSVGDQEIEIRYTRMLITSASPLEMGMPLAGDHVLTPLIGQILMMPDPMPDL